MADPETNATEEQQQVVSLYYRGVSDEQVAAITRAVRAVLDGRDPVRELEEAQTLIRDIQQNVAVHGGPAADALAEAYEEGAP